MSAILVAPPDWTNELDLYQEMRSQVVVELNLTPGGLCVRYQDGWLRSLVTV